MDTLPPRAHLRNTIRERLLAEFRSHGRWIGELSSSPLATAVAVFALSCIDGHTHRTAIERGLSWLETHENDGGGWGDCDRSPSNLSATLLAWSALSLAPPGNRSAARAEAWLASKAGSLEPRDIVQAVLDRYGNDRTFSAPILTLCALAGRLGPDPWRWVPQLPFELAVLPHAVFTWLRLPVVSYAIPALIAIGLVRHARRPSGGAALRGLARRRALAVLGAIQPSHGGYLEATPLTAFVVMGLAAAGLRTHPVAARGVEFIRQSMRGDGSWPIDTNLSTWVTTLAVNAGASEWLTEQERMAVRDWLLGQQFRREHPYTHSAPGGWSWTDLPGAVPDADDTAGALLALRRLGEPDERVRAAGRLGCRWLLDAQNRDGGIPTFCRGWGALPFDRSCPDITAHFLRALVEWRGDLDPAARRRVAPAVERAFKYLARAQRADGAWIPLWFGNPFEVDQENRIYGTAQVLLALRGMPAAGAMTGAAVRMLEAAQGEDGGWGGAAGVAASVEETALAVAAVAGFGREAAVARGLAWLSRHIDRPPAPIGLYFTGLWYHEKLYPLVFAAAAIENAERRSAPGLIPPTASPAP